MNDADSALETAYTDASGQKRWRLKALVAAHLLASPTLVSEHLIPGHINYLPVMWAVGSLVIAQLILLAFWAGMANRSAALRLAGAVLGTVYLASLSLLGAVMAPRLPGMPEPDLVKDSLKDILHFAAAVLIFTALFWAARRWVVELRLTSVAEQASQPEHYQFSIRRVLVITSIAAIVLALMRSESSEILFVVAFVINAVCASWAALAIGPARLRVGLVLCLAVSLGVAVAFEGIKSANQIIWWLSPAFAASLVLPSVIIIASLLVVRSCGYRLVALRNRKR